MHVLLDCGVIDYSSFQGGEGDLDSPVCHITLEMALRDAGEYVMGERQFSAACLGTGVIRIFLTMITKTIITNINWAFITF